MGEWLAWLVPVPARQPSPVVAGTLPLCCVFSPAPGASCLPVQEDPYLEYDLFYKRKSNAGRQGAEGEGGWGVVGSFG